MPYIAPEHRQWAKTRPTTPGELNFAITSLVVSYLSQRGTSYAVLNDIVGALESAKAEFQRRVVGPYEDTKIKQNGDVYGLTR